MKQFKELADGTKFFVRGGFEFLKTNESNTYNSVFVEDAHMGVKHPDDTPTFSSIDELNAHYPEDTQEAEIFN